MFLALTTNTGTTPHKQNGFRYTLPSTSSQTVVFDTRNPSGSFYDLEIGGQVFVGGDNWIPKSNFWIQYFRVYINYFPNSVDEMINLAIMGIGNIFSHFRHSTSYFSSIFRHALHCSL